MLKAGWLVAATLALVFASGCDEVKREARAAKAKLGDPRDVIASTCTEGSSPMCACIVEETVTTMQAGPRAIIALFESPEAVWGDVIKSLSPADRDRTLRLRSAAEATCNRRFFGGPERNVAMGKVERRSGPTRRPMQTIHGSCASEGNSRDVCACYEATLKNVLSDDAYNGFKNDASFPPPLETLPPKHRRTALATIASARSVCGLK